MRQTRPVAMLLACLAISIGTKANNPSETSRLGFIENKGQIINQSNESNAQTLFLFPTRRGMNVQLRENGLSYDTYHSSSEKNTYDIHRLDLNLLGASNISQISGEEILAGETHFGSSRNQMLNRVKTFGKVRYTEIYPGVDFLVSFTEEGLLKYDFEIEQASQVDQIQLQYEGFDYFELKDNKLIFDLSGTQLTEEIPASWTTADGRSIEVKYEIIESRANSVVIGLKLPKDIEPQTAITIDPLAKLEWGTYYGDEFEDVGNGIATDSLGNIFACGTTHSINGFASEGSFQSVFSGGNTDAYLVKFNQHGLRHWATYYGGSGDDEGLDVDVDAHQYVYLVGKTTSQDSIGVHGIHQSTSGGGTDGFIAKFDRFGIMVWDSFLGGPGEDEGTSCHADLYGNVAVVGITDAGEFLTNDSVSPSLPYQAGLDGYLAIFDLNGALTKSRFIGGEGEDQLNGIEQDSLQNLILVGSTTSADNIAEGNALQSEIGGLQDAFVMKIDTNDAVVWTSYFGGDSLDNATGVESVGDTLFISGYTGSLFSFPDTLGNQDTLGGNLDAFLLSILPSGDINWFTYLGAENDDVANGISRDQGNGLYIVGTTLSDSIMGFSQSHLLQGQGAEDAFVMKFSKSGTKEWGTYYGGSQPDFGSDIVVYGFTSVYVTGQTNSTEQISQEGPEEFPHQSIISADSSDAFIARFTQTLSTPCLSICNGGSPTGSGVPAPIGVCIGDSILISVYGGALGLEGEWIWYEGACGGTDNFIGEGNEIWVAPIVATTYYVRAESVDCVTECTYVTVFVDYPNTVTAWAVDSVCAGETVNLYADGGYSYVWEGPNDSTYTDQNPILDSVSMDFAGMYQVIAYTEFGCSDTTAIDVEIIPGPIFSSTVIPVDCPGDATGSIALTTSNDSIVFNWLSFESDSTFVDSLSAGNYSVLATNEYGCTLVSTISVEESAFSIDSLNYEHAWCNQPNGFAQIFVTSDSPHEVIWYPNNVTGPLAMELLPGVYTAIVTNENGCSDSTTVTIQNLGEFTTVIDPDSLFLEILMTEEIFAYTIPTIENITYNWWPEAGLSCSDCPNPILNPDTTTYYFVEITSSMGCHSTDSIHVERELPLPVAFVPTLFSPNADGLNDELCVLGTRIISFELKIFNNGGKEIFSTNTEDKCWDGTIDGVPQTGTFIFTMTAILEENMTHNETGNITIKR